LDIKLPIRVTGLPHPELSWYHNDKLIREDDHVKIKRDGDIAWLLVKNCKPEDTGMYRCTARNREGEDTCQAKLEIVDKM